MSFSPLPASESGASVPPGAASSASLGLAAPRRSAALLILAGGLLAVIATFVPWVQIAWQAIDDEPAGAFMVIPGRDLTHMVLDTLQAPRILSVETVFALLFSWGVPLLLVALAVVALLAPRRGMPSRGIRTTALVLTICAVGWVGVVTWVAFLPHFDMLVTTNTLQAGPFIALLGYGAALAGLVWLMPRRNAPVLAA